MGQNWFLLLRKLRAQATMTGHLRGHPVSFPSPVGSRAIPYCFSRMGWCRGGTHLSATRSRKLGPYSSEGALDLSQPLRPHPGRRLPAPIRRHPPSRVLLESSLWLWKKPREGVMVRTESGCSRAPTAAASPRLELLIGGLWKGCRGIAPSVAWPLLAMWGSVRWRLLLGGNEVPGSLAESFMHISYIHLLLSGAGTRQTAVLESTDREARGPDQPGDLGGCFANRLGGALSGEPMSSEKEPGHHWSVSNGPCLAVGRPGRDPQFRPNLERPGP